MGKNKFAVVDHHNLSVGPNGSNAISTHSVDMYEVSTAKVLKGGAADSLAERSAEVFYAIHGNWFVIAIGSDVYLFDVSVGCTEFSPDSSKGRIECNKDSKDKRIFILPDDARVVALQFLPSTDVLLILLNNGTAFFGSPTNRLSYQLKDAFPPFDQCAMCVVKRTGNDFCVAISDCQGTVHFLTIPPFDVGIHDEEQFCRAFSSVQKLCFDGSQTFGNIHFVAKVVDSFVFFPKQKDASVFACFLHPSAECTNFFPMFTLKDDVQMVRTVGSFVCVLNSNSQLAIFDQNLIQVHGMSLDADCAVVDFEFLDVGDYFEFQENVKILLKVKTERGSEFKIRQFNEEDIQFTRRCSEHAVLVPSSTPGDENSIIYIDAFPPSSSNDIFVRFVGEAQPELRLKKLIEFKRFDDALAFAKSNNLPTDPVYIELSLYYQEQIQNGKDGTYEEGTFKELLQTLRLLSDHNSAGDHCVAILNFVNQYEHIKTILDFAKSLKITDEYTQKDIARFRYELASYRMLFEANGLRFDGNSPWPQFLSSGSHREFFDAFCENGQMAEARLLLSRYANIAQELQDELSMKKLLAVFRAAIIEKPHNNGAISQFVEIELIPLLLTSNTALNTKTVCASFCDFLVDISLQLERLEPKSFPHASLHFAETFNRAIDLLRGDCHTSEKHVTFLHILRQLDEGETDEGILGRLNQLIRNLKKLCKIHTVYQCPMSYSEFLSHDVNSICYSIMDRIRTTSSVREIVEQFVFPYVEENGLDRNKVLYDYIKQISSSYYSQAAGQGHTWDLLCLQITEQITDANLRCRAIIEIASNAVPPWSLQLSKVVRTVVAQGDKIDPELISSLRKQCLYADLGQIFIKYEISLINRSRVFGGGGLRSLLQYIFKVSRRDMASKLQDASRVVELYEELEGKSLFAAVDCYYLYAVVLIKQMTDGNDMKSLTDLFQLIKSSHEAESVAQKLITHLKCLLSPTKIKAVIPLRLVWLGCLLCIAERYLPPLSARKLIRDARAIRQLQTEHQIIIGFSTFREKGQCIAFLEKFIEAPNAKSIVEVNSFGSLLCLDVSEICKAIIGVHIKNGLPEAALKALKYMTSMVHSPTKAHLVIALDTCTFVCWKLTESVRDESTNEQRIVSAGTIVRAFQSVLPKLIDWSVSLGENRYFGSFSKISRYVFFFLLVLDQCAVGDDMAKASESDPFLADISLAPIKCLSADGNKSSNKLYVTKARTGVLLPHQEGTMYNTIAVVKAVSVVASSVVESPVDAKQREQFHEQMCEAWYCLFDHLSSAHILLEIHARKLANALDCFATTGNSVLAGIERHVLELCKKIFSFPVADVHLAAHLLLGLSPDEMRKNLHELRRSVQLRKNIRSTLNLICVSLFVLSVADQDMNIIKQVAVWHETSQWQKKLIKQNVNMGAKQLKRDNIYELVGEFAKAILPSSFLYEYCKEANCAPACILLNYAVELCKLSSSLASDVNRFELCIETAKASISCAEMDERTLTVLIDTVKDISPYNYEAIELLFVTMNAIAASDKIGSENADLVRIRDGYMLLKFLRCTIRGKGISSGEIRWYKLFTSQKNWNTSLSYVTNTELTSPEETAAATSPLDDSAVGTVRQQSNLLPSNDSNSILPSLAAKRLPFHVLFNEENETDKFQSKMIYHELTIFNVQHWTSLIEETTSILQHSRSHLLVGSITNHVNETVKFKRELSSDDLCQIKQLIYDYPRLSILKGLASRFQRLPLSQTKISLMKLCCEVIEEWLRDFDELKLPPKEGQIEYKSYSSVLRELLVVIETEFLLANNSVLNSDTVSLTQKSNELVNYILCRNEIDWAEKESISRCFGIVESISKIHSVDVEGVFLALIDRWIIEGQEHSEQTVAQMTSDPDSTIDFTGPSVLSNSINTEDSDFFVPVLYDDPRTTRIIVLLRRIKDPMKTIIELSHKSEQDVSVLPGGYVTKIRIACCILRFLTDEQMKEMFNVSLDQFYVNFVSMLDQRLYSLCRIELPLKELKEADKRVEFVRTILSPQTIFRQTPEIARLLVCLIIDNDIDDLSLLGKAAQRLVQLRLSTPLMELLKYLRNIKGKDIRTIPNISAFYAKTFEALFDKIDAPSSGKELASLVFFLTSCPVEGGGHFARSVSLLASSGAIFASSLAAISDNSTAAVNLVDERDKKI